MCLAICAFCIHFSMLRSMFDVPVGNVKIGSSGFSLGFRQSTASFDNGTFTSFWVFCIFILIYKVLPSGALTIFPHVNERTSLRRSPVRGEQERTFHILMGARRSHYRFHFLQCKVFPHAFGRLILLF